MQGGYIHTLPSLLENYSPNLDRLPHFLLCLAVKVHVDVTVAVRKFSYSSQVDWSTEKNCFFTFARECATFYSLKHDPFIADSQSIDATGSSPSDPDLEGNTTLYKSSPWKWTIEHVIFPAVKTEFIPPFSMADDGTVLKIADLHELYKVFERC